MSYQSKVLLGMSGGVDSSAAANYLINSGYEVLGCTCIFCNNSNIENDIQRAKKICDDLNIEHIVCDVRSKFKTEIIDEFCNSYLNGDTPSPCVMCNERVKIPTLLKMADENNCQFIATGHYASIIEDNGKFYVKKHDDYKKDQSYMLSRLTQKELSRIILPLSNVVNKNQVVENIQNKTTVSFKEVNESQDICFASKGYKEFLKKQNITSSTGDILSTNGEVLGTHSGIHNYTIGQRKGIGVVINSDPLYVIDKDIKNNTITIGSRDELLCNNFIAKDFISHSFNDLNKEIYCVTRYHGRKTKCSISNSKDNKINIEVENPTFKPANGQYVVFYSNDVVIGSAVVCKD